MKKSGLSSLVFVVASILGAGASLLPVSASAEPVAVCVDDLCTVTIAFSGEAVSWSPPANARNLSFELYGAQGGKTGGLGGKVTGNLSVIPQSLTVVVGGAGLSGSAVAGGFNGGGRAGTSSGLEGSGGGATDIRLAAELETRIAVAGGGGGRGAGLGGTGGMGGGLTGGNGKTGQGGGGGGGTQLAGGAGGVRFGTGTNGTAGSLGVGGTGGEGSVFGGGGGGGGYYGGGGGGSDTDGCCYDAGGGGGGSSFTDPSLVSSVVHSQAVRSGSGLAILRYQLVPLLESITTTSTISNFENPTFGVLFSQAVTGFDPTDVRVSHSGDGCASLSVTGSGASYEIVLGGCSDGLVSVSVVAGAVSNAQLPGPETTVSSESILLDYLSPEVGSWSMAEDGSWVEVTLTELVTVLSLEKFEFVSTNPECLVSEPLTTAELKFLITFSGCAEADYTFTLLSASLLDSAGNLGPAANLVFAFNYPRPEVSPPRENVENPVSEVPLEEPVETPKKQPKEKTKPISQPETVKAKEIVPEVEPEEPIFEEPIAQESAPSEDISANPPLRQAAQELIAAGEEPAGGPGAMVFWLAALGLIALLGGIFLGWKKLPGSLAS